MALTSGSMTSRRRSACCASSGRDAGCVPAFWLGSADGAPPSPAQPPVRTKRTRATMSCVRIPWLRGSRCWCRANRNLRCSKRVTDVLLRILQELFGSAQGAPASVQHFPGLRFHRADPLGGLRAHRRCLSSHSALDLPPPEQDADCAGDRSQNEDLTGSHFFFSPSFVFLACDRG